MKGTMLGKAPGKLKNGFLGIAGAERVRRKGVPTKMEERLDWAHGTGLGGDESQLDIFSWCAGRAMGSVGQKRRMAVFRS